MKRKTEEKKDREGSSPPKEKKRKVSSKFAPAASWVSD